jgi:pimeloyl-ACP methyl ester carboxylesterase
MILPYHPGFGPTSDHPGLGGMEAYLDHYENVLKELGIEKVILGGISIGGWMATEFALRHPDMVQKLILVAPGGVFDPSVPMPDLNSLPPGEILNYLAHDPRVFDPYLPKTQEDADKFQAMLAGEGETLAGIAPQGPFRPGIEEELKKLDMPVLLLWGKEDRVLPPALAESWQKALPSVDLRYFEGAGHTLLDESAEAREAVMEFLG